MVPFPCSFPPLSFATFIFFFLLFRLSLYLLQCLLYSPPLLFLLPSTLLLYSFLSSLYNYPFQSPAISYFSLISFLFLVLFFVVILHLILVAFRISQSHIILPPVILPLSFSFGLVRILSLVICLSSVLSFSFSVIYFFPPPQIFHNVFVSLTLSHRLSFISIFSSHFPL